MKIVQILYSLDMGGIEEFAINLANYLSYDKVNNNMIVVSKGRNNKWCNNRYKQIEKSGTNIYDVSDGNKISKFIKLIKIIAEIKPQLIIIHHEKNTLRLLLTKVFFKIKIIQVQHNTKIHAKLIHRFFVKCFVDKYICVSQSVLKTLRENIKISNKKVLYINNGIVLKNYEVIKKHSNDYITIGGVGRLCDQKNFIGLMNILHSIIDENPTINIKVLIAGEGPQQNQISELTKKYKNISLLGNVDDMKSFYEKIDIYATYSKYEGFSLALLEAVASKCAIITTETSGSSLIIKDGYNGYIIEQQNEKLFKEKLIKLIKNQSIRDEFVINGEKVITKYDFSNTYKQYKKIFEELLYERSL